MKWFLIFVFVVLFVGGSYYLFKKEVYLSPEAVNAVCSPGETLECSDDKGYLGNKICNDEGSEFGNCVLEEFCGDLAINGNENCDDGDSAGSDGCSEFCRIDSGWICEGVPSRCSVPEDNDPSEFGLNVPEISKSTGIIR